MGYDGMVHNRFDELDMKNRDELKTKEYVWLPYIDYMAPN